MNLAKSDRRHSFGYFNVESFVGNMSVKSKLSRFLLGFRPS